MGGGGKHFPLPISGVTPTTGRLRISAIWRFPETLREHGVDVEDQQTRHRIETEARARQAVVAVNFPGALRMVLRKKLLIRDCSMDSVARLMGMRRRTLDRRLQRHGVHYSELLESVQADLARRLLTDTKMPVQHVAEALRFSNAANFATAFRRWTGATPQRVSAPHAGVRSVRRTMTR